MSPSMEILVSVAMSFLMEMPPEPSLEQLCADSAIIASARAVRESPVIESFSFAAYRLVVFEPVDVFKGRSDLIAVKPSVLDGKHPERRLFSVLIATSRPNPCYQVPSYAPGKEYLLFLDTQCAFAVHGRNRLDTDWAERPYTNAIGQRIRAIVAEQVSISLRRWSNPGESGDIPAGAQEHTEVLTDYDKKNGYSRKAYYTLGEVRIGERGWWTTGKMAYESPMRHGRKHGLFRGWYSDGKLWQERFFRNGDLHGLVRQWNEHGDLSVSFWLDGRNVTREAYDQECELDPALPRIREAASQPASQPAGSVEPENNSLRAKP